MKLLLVADAVGGVFTFAVELARALAARGVDVVLATEGARLSPDQRRAVASIPRVVHEERAYRLEWMEEPWDDVAASGEWLLDLAARERPDVVHTNAYAHGALPFAAPKVVVAHSCVMSWFEAVKGEPAPPSWERYRRVVRAGLLGADAVVAPSRAMAAALVRHHGPIPAPLVVPNGRDGGRFAPAPKEELVLGAGRLWDEAKNAAALARVAPALPWPVLIAGEVVRGGAGQGEARAGSPVFLGRLPEDDLAAWLSRAAIFAHPARYEPFGLAVLEAALSGCALVLGDVASLRENWDGAAVFVAPGDDAEIAEGVRALAADAPRRAALAERARARARELTPARMAAAYLDVYRAVLSRPTAPAGAHP